MQSTSDKVRAVLPSDTRFWTKNGTEYHGPAPYRMGSDSKALSIEFTGDEYGRFQDFVSGDKGSLYTLAKLLQVEPSYEKIPANNSRKAQSLADYERDKNLLSGWLKRYGWSQGTHKNRPCIFIPASDGTTQVRFLDELEPRYTWKESRNGKPLPFYGTQRAIDMSKRLDLNFIVLTNGAGSVESCLFYDIPAFCVLGGEGGFGETHAKNILSKYEGYVVIALDCDTKGRQATENISKLLGDRSIVIDIDMGLNADMGDFCKLWGDWSLERVQELARKAYKYRRPRNAHEALDTVIQIVRGELQAQGRIVEQPFTLLHQFGIHCEVFEPNMLTGVLGLSGHGKTSFWHSIIAQLIYKHRRYGFMVDSREYSPEQDTMRRTQMVTQDNKMNYRAIKLHELALQEISEDVPSYERRGKLLSNEELEKLIELSETNKKHWLGHIEYAEEYLYIEDTLDYMRRKTLELRSQDTPIDIWIFDYLTLYKARSETLSGKDGTISNIIVEIVKAACRSVNVHGIVMLQPNKTPTIEQLSKNNRLTVRDASYVNENHFNLFLGLNTIYGRKAFWDSDTEWYAKRDYSENENGEWLMDKAMLIDKSYACTIEVLKQNMGSKNYVNIRGDFSNLRWLDRTWHSTDLCLPFIT